MKQGLSNLAFFQNVNNRVQRDYILVVDKSGSMAGSNWREAEKAVAALAPNIVRCDPDGITLYFFSSRGLCAFFSLLSTLKPYLSILYLYSTRLVSQIRERA